MFTDDYARVALALAVVDVCVCAGVLRHRGARRGDGVRGAGGAGPRLRAAGRHLPRLHPLRHPHQGLRLQGKSTSYSTLI